MLFVQVIQLVNCLFCTTIMPTSNNDSYCHRQATVSFKFRIACSFLNRKAFGPLVAGQVLNAQTTKSSSHEFPIPRSRAYSHGFESTCGHVIS